MNLASRIKRKMKAFSGGGDQRAVAVETTSEGVVYLSPEIADFSEIPTEYREVIDLSTGKVPSGIELKGKFGTNCILVRDRRYINEPLKVVINVVPQAKLQPNVVIEYGKARGKLTFHVIRGNCRAHFGYLDVVNIRTEMDFQGVVRIGSGTSAVYMLILSARGELSIGKDCLVSRNVTLCAGVHHAIVDLSDGEAVVRPQLMDMVIGDHVWLGYGSSVIGHANIGSGCIVGACAAVATTTPENALIVGNPGTVKKTNVTWARPPDMIDPKTQRYLDEMPVEASPPTIAQFGSAHSKM